MYWLFARGDLVITMRSPLKEKNANQALKKANGSNLELKNEKAKQSVASNVYAAGTPSGAVDPSIKTWQRHWKEIMTRSIFYFHQLDSTSRDRVAPTLASLGAKIQTFFDREVTIVVSNSKATVADSSSSNDTLTIARRHDMKIWTFEKLIRFLTYLGHTPNKTALEPPSQKLSHLLKEEKLLGHHSDRDPATKREDYYYFKNPYILVWDPLHHHRPTLCREYTRTGPTSDDGDWPRMKLTEPGRCVFVVADKDSKRPYAPVTNAAVAPAVPAAPTLAATAIAAQGAMTPVKSIGSATASQSHASTGCEQIGNKRKSEQLGLSNNGTSYAANDGSPSINDEFSKKVILKDQNGIAVPVELAASARTSVTSSMINGASPASNNASTAYKFYEIAASGVRSNNSTIASIAMSGDMNRQNGLAAPTAQVPSREIANLKRKVLSRTYSTHVNPSGRTNLGASPITTATKQTGYMRSVKEEEESEKKEKEKKKEGDDTEDIENRPPNSVSTPSKSVEVGVPKKKAIEQRQQHSKRDKSKTSTSRTLKATKIPEYERDRDQRGGYCENCRENFDRFIDHINDAKHRNFASDKRNFEKLDDFLRIIQRK